MLKATRVKKKNQKNPTPKKQLFDIILVINIIFFIQKGILLGFRAAEPRRGLLDLAVDGVFFFFWRGKYSF